MSDLCCEPVAAVWAPNGQTSSSSAGYLTPAAFAGTFTATSDWLRNPDQLRRSPIAPRALLRQSQPETLASPGERRGSQQIGNFCSSCAVPVPDFVSPKTRPVVALTYLAELSVHRSSRPICTIANGQMCGGGVVTSSAAWQPKSARLACARHPLPTAEMRGPPPRLRKALDAKRESRPR
jgi:hypothetical protein